MVRLLLTATAISFVVGVLPAFASCTDRCADGRCKGNTYTWYSACMPSCIAKCKIQCQQNPALCVQKEAERKRNGSRN